VRFEEVNPQFNDVISTTAPLTVVATPNGPVYVYVAQKDQNGFTVRQLNGADSGIVIDWHVTARRKDYEEQEPVTEPTTTEFSVPAPDPDASVPTPEEGTEGEPPEGEEGLVPDPEPEVIQEPEPLPEPALMVIPQEEPGESINEP
jgi:hypothetical protein